MTTSTDNAMYNDSVSNIQLRHLADLGVDLYHIAGRVDVDDSFVDQALSSDRPLPAEVQDTLLNEIGARLDEARRALHEVTDDTLYFSLP